MVWSQVYDPLNNAWVSAAVAALPVIVLLGALGIFRVKAHVAALLGLAVSLALAILIFGMPASMAAKTALLGAAFGLLPIGWIILNIIFLYRLTDYDRGLGAGSQAMATEHQVHASTVSAPIAAARPPNLRNVKGSPSSTTPRPAVTIKPICAIGPCAVRKCSGFTPFAAERL